MAQDINEKIRAAAQAKNVDPEVALRIANVESGGKPAAKNPRSSAEGIFQIIDDTWRRYGGRPGKKLDADENIRVGTDILADNTAKLTKALGRSPQGHEVYTAHFFGPEKGKQILQADPATPLNSLLSKDVLKANPELRNQTVGQFLGNMQNKMGKSNRSAGAGMEAGPTPSEETMTKALGQNIAGMGTGYQAALALSFLSDEKGDKEDDEEDKDSGPSAAEQLAQYKPVNSLEGVDIGYSSPFAQPQAAQPQQVAQAEQPQVFAHGGVVHRADGSPMGGENVDHLTPQEIERMAAAQAPAFVTPSSGRGRVAGNISQALNSGEAYPAMVRGAGDVAYDIVGGPVDIANMVIKASPLISKYVPEKPVMGSDWIKEKMTAAGIRPADETDPTLKGFRTFGELGASSVNPTGALQKVAQADLKAADMLRRMVEPNTEARAAAAKASLQEMRPVELNLDQALAASRAREQQSSILPIQPPAKKTPELTSVQPPVQMALPLQEATPAKKGKPVAGPIYSHLPSDEAPFVGRLDEYMANLPGPVQKQQLLNQLKGKFRDYEIGRAEEAFKDLEANAKLTPSDALNRIKSVYDPGKYKTTVLPPNPEDPTANWRSKDNVYFNESTDQGQHLGVIHLTENLPPEVLQRKVEAAEARNAVRVLTKSGMYAGNYTDEMNQLDNFLKNSSIRPSPELQQKLQTGISQYRGIRDYERDVEIAHDRLLYPNIAPGYMDERNMLVDKFLAENPGMMYSEAVAKAEPIATDSMAKQGNSWLVANGYPPVKVPNFFEVGPNPHVYAMNTPEIKNSIKAAFEPAKEKVLELDQNLNKHMKGVERRFQAEYADDLPYMGQHATMGGGPSPISFSRYSEHTAQIPGLGKVDGIYVNELQSDLLDDLRKNGPKGRNKPLDIKEAEAIQDNLISLNSQRDEAYKSGNNKLAEQLDNQILSAEGRLKTLSVRLNPSRAEPPDYALKEVFHKMEASGAVAQQLMAKNAIIGAIQQGKRFVAFPGAESDQSQLYEKLPRVLKDVVKDLGPGFEMRDVTLSNQDGNKFSHNAVVWGPEAAARIQKKGVPFATGGSVDKANIDHRKYL